MDIPEHIQVALGIGTPSTTEQLADAIDEWPSAQAAFGLSTDDFTAAASEVERGGDLVEVSQLARPPRDWKYFELICDESRDCFGLCTPKSRLDVQPPPPTAAGQALVKGWFANPTVLEGNSVREGLLVTGLGAVAKNRDFARRLIPEWAAACLLLEDSTVPPSWVTGAQIFLRGDSRILNVQPPRFNFEGLFLESLTEVKAKWRYLSLYRILEHGYLSEIFDALKSGFFVSPRESLDRAVASIESELNQFITLADTAALKQEFETFFDDFERAKAIPNRFAAAIDHSIKLGGQIKKINAKWQHGVLVCYKIRSAIVHAGFSSPIFDAYPDGAGCLAALLPSLESIILNYLRITIA